MACLVARRRPSMSTLGCSTSRSKVYRSDTGCEELVAKLDQPVDLRLRVGDVLLATWPGALQSDVPAGGVADRTQLLGEGGRGRGRGGGVWRGLAHQLTSSSRC